jgi:hypothetical protein
MLIIAALRDFAEGLTRGLGLYLTERNSFTEMTLTPRIPPRDRR